MARGSAGVKNATSSADYRAAAAEFDQAATAAPWYGDAYYNAGIAYSKAEDHSAAIRELKLYLLTSPSEADQKDARTRIFEEEFLTEKAAKTADAQLAAEKVKKARILIIPGAGIGEVRLGMMESEVISALGAPSARQEFANGGANLQFGKLGLNLSRDRMVTSVGTSDRADFVTSEGVGIGSSMSSVSSAMGTPDDTLKNPYGAGVIWCYRRGIWLTFYNPKVPSEVSQLSVVRVEDSACK